MLHWETVSPELKQILIKLFENEIIIKSFRLGGGTSLALQHGHRISVDIDLFSEIKIETEIISHILLSKDFSATDIHSGEFGIFCKINNIKTDFLSWNIPFMRSAKTELNISVIDTEEIAAMKIFAIMQRGEKKDYIDIAFLLKQYSLEQILNFYVERHPKSDKGLALKHIISFGDIDFQPEPTMMINFSWEEAKNILLQAVKKYIQ